MAWRGGTKSNDVERSSLEWFPFGITLAWRRRAPVMNDGPPTAFTTYYRDGDANQYYGEVIGHLDDRVAAHRFGSVTGSMVRISVDLGVGPVWPPLTQMIRLPP